MQPVTTPSPIQRFVHGDGIEGTRQLEPESVHAVISDIPYGIGADDWDVLHNNTNSAYRGASPAQLRSGSTFKSRGKPINGWSAADRAIPLEYQQWCARWAADWYRALKPGGSAIVFAGRRYSHRLISAMEDVGFSLKDQLAWVKPNAPHRAQRLSVVYERRGNLGAAEQWESWRLGNLRPTFEPIVWCTKPYPIGTTIADNVLNYGVGAYSPAAIQAVSGDVSNVLKTGGTREEGGLHPTQKPESLMRALVGLVTIPGQVVLDPFAGSGTTLVAAKSLGRDYIGFEIDQEFAQVADKRLQSTVEIRQLW
ncbi:MAG: site-specific DNA-methyltransferase [Mycobacterium sp.]|nr:site-specific DNA-methyltransferase [Mycobacterium sp.]